MATTGTAIGQLAGRDHSELREVAVRTVGEQAAIAMSCGRLPKRRPGVDPNEDAALVAVGSQGVFAAVMDGHLGGDAAEETLAAAGEWARSLVEEPADHPRRMLNSVLKSAQKRIGERLAAVSEDRRNSRTAVTLALAVDRKVYVATLGDTVALLARRGRGRWVQFRETGDFMGAQPAMAPLQAAKRSGADRLILASDGLIDFTPSGFVVDTLGRPEIATAQPEAVVRALMDGALMGGAGDNVTVVCVDL
ncbi:MAG TPA: protein phosphatase 2C domain-containing protein [Egibacteraceae bacterium]|nr:protein phosphatase 2C domain-containing protein [Egibacteraceae bacterium]